MAIGALAPCVRVVVVAVFAWQERPEGGGLAALAMLVQRRGGGPAEDLRGRGTQLLGSLRSDLGRHYTSIITQPSGSWEALHQYYYTTIWISTTIWRYSYKVHSFILQKKKKIGEVNANAAHLSVDS